MEDIQALQVLDSLPVESVSGVQLTYSDSGILKARLKTPRMDRYTGETDFLEMPEGLHVDFYSGGRIASWMDAGYAIKYEDEDVFEARDSVVVINERGDRLDTDKLLWNRREKTIFTDKHVTITTETEILMGEGMEADEAFDHWKILNPSGSFYLEEEPDSNTQLPPPPPREE
jgi:LPS export ABC transporter protein LptC